MLLQNVSTIDRTIRILVGFLLMLAAYFTQENPDVMFAFTLGSFYPLLTALISWDPIYAAIASAFTKEGVTHKL